MADLSLPWLAAAIATAAALGIPALLCLRGSMASRLAAYQLASVVTTLALVEMAFAFGESAALDLAVTLGLLSLPGTALLAVFMERWL